MIEERQPAAQTRPISLGLLGVPQLRIGGQPVRLAYLKAEALLYYLAATGRAHSRGSLATLLWSQVPEKRARNSLRNALYTVRRGLEPAGALIVERDTVRLDMDPVRLDLTSFRAAVEQSHDAATLSGALALWRGPFLDGLNLPAAPAFEEWLADQRAFYDNLYRHGLFHLGQLFGAEKRLPEAYRAIEQLLALDPLHEAGHRQLMRLYLQSGNRAAALRQYETLRAILVKELGVDPAPATQSLHLEILRAGDRTLPQAQGPPWTTRPAGPYRFVGRQRELSALDELFQGSLPGGPARPVMLEGEPGIGKTRLAHEWLATVPQARTLSTRCFQSERAIPFHPWIDLIRSALKQTPLPQLGLADVWLTELAQLVPEIRLQRPDLELIPLPDPDLARGRIIQAIHHWLEALSRDSTLASFTRRKGTPSSSSKFCRPSPRRI